MNAPAMPESSGVPVHIISTRTLFTRCCRLQFVTVMNINYISGVLRQQFITAKNALKQGIRTHPVLLQRSSQL